MIVFLVLLNNSFSVYVIRNRNFINGVLNQLDPVDVNLFIDHSQIVQLECLRSGIWGTNETWGRMLAYNERGDLYRAASTQS